NYRKSRAEPLYYMAHVLRENKEFEKAYEIAKIASTQPATNDNLFVQQWIYDYGLALEHSVCAYWVGKYKECQKICLELLKKDLTDDVYETVTANLQFANLKLLDETLK